MIEKHTKNQTYLLLGIIPLLRIVTTNYLQPIKVPKPEAKTRKPQP